MLIQKLSINNPGLIMYLDVLVFGAHPDDAELGMGGTIARLAKNGLKVGIVDFTKGELGTRGTAETRQKESVQAGICMKVAVRENLHIQDGAVTQSKENIAKIVTEIRKYRPKIVFAPYFNDRHPDHIEASKAVKQSMFFSGLEKFHSISDDKKQAAYRPKKLYYYMQMQEFQPSFIVDISETFELKMKAIKTYATQFFDPKSIEPETFISQPDFLKFIESRAQVYGFKIGKLYGEPFFCEENIEYDIKEFFI
jgi:bacillithiol biosynthesis deacetylase BshB1